MTWVIKILQRDIEKIDTTWNGVAWVDTSLGTADFMLNDFQFSDSTWREVSYTLIEDENLTRRFSTSADVVLTSNSRRYQFIDPLIEEIFLTLPQNPRFHERYLIKNLSEVNNKISVRGIPNGDTLFTLDSTDELAILFHDEVDWHIAI